MKAKEFRKSLDYATGYNPAYNERTYTESQVDDISEKFSEHQNKELIEEIKLLKLQLNDDMDLPYIDMKPISRKKYKLTEIKANKK